MQDKAAVRGFLGYVVPFFVIFIALYLGYTWLDPYLAHYYAALASSVSGFLGLFDPAVGSYDNVLSYGGIGSLQVVAGCDGVTFVVLMLAAVLPFPGRLREKLIGLAVLLPLLLAFNWLRLLILAIVKFYFPGNFDLFHVYLFQPVMILFTIGVFVAWISYNESKLNVS